MFKTQLTTITFFLLYFGAKVLETHQVNVCEPSTEQPFYCTCEPSDDVGHASSVICILWNATSLTENSDIWFQFMSQANIVSLEFNCSSALLTFIPDKMFIASKTNLEQFHMNGCQLGVLRANALSGQANLTDAKLDRNEITELEPNAISELPALTKLSLTENLIRSLPVDALSNLPSLQELQLDRSQLESIEDGAFSHLSNLKLLNLASNKLKSLTSRTFDGLVNVVEIDLFNNQLEVLPDYAFNGTPALRILELRKNKISSIEAKAFNNLFDLNVLVLDKNQLHVIDEPIFRGAPNLRHISLSQNQLTLVTENVFGNLAMLQDEFFHLYLKDNIWACYCQLLWFETLHDKIRNVQTRENLRHIKCTVPSTETSETATLLSLTANEQLNIIREFVGDPRIQAKCAELNLVTSSKRDLLTEQEKDGDNSIQQEPTTSGERSGKATHTSSGSGSSQSTNDAIRALPPKSSSLDPTALNSAASCLGSAGGHILLVATMVTVITAYFSISNRLVGHLVLFASCCYLGVALKIG